jgi:hypothetical protein
MNGGKNNPIKAELDDQGEKTGNYLVKFKLKALDIEAAVISS